MVSTTAVLPLREQKYTQSEQNALYLQVYLA